MRRKSAVWRPRANRSVLYYSAGCRLIAMAAPRYRAGLWLLTHHWAAQPRFPARVRASWARIGVFHRGDDIGIHAMFSAGFRTNS